MFKYILIFFLLIAFVPSFRRFIFWLLVGRKLTKQQQQYTNQTQRQEGDIKVETNPDKNKNTPKTGQYIDYEELK